MMNDTSYETIAAAIPAFLATIIRVWFPIATDDGPAGYISRTAAEWLADGAEFCGFPVELLAEEILRCRAAGAFTERAYLKVSRVGSHTALCRRDRRAIWGAIKGWPDARVNPFLRD